MANGYVSSSNTAVKERQNGDHQIRITYLNSILAHRSEIRSETTQLIGEQMAIRKMAEDYEAISPCKSEFCRMRSLELQDKLNEYELAMGGQITLAQDNFGPRTKRAIDKLRKQDMLWRNQASNQLENVIFMMRVELNYGMAYLDTTLSINR